MTGVESLYPFLYAGSTDLAAVLADVRRSTVDKVGEIAALRREVAYQCEDDLIGAAAAIAASFEAGGRLYTFGNGGSSTDAVALAQLFLDPGPDWRPLPAAALTVDVAVLTALSNDVGFEVVFARQIAAAGRPGDVAVALSTSGGSRNVLRGLEEAHERGLVTVGFAGYSGGAMAESAQKGVIDHLFIMPSASVHRIQEAQTTTYHVLWELTQLALG